MVPYADLMWGSSCEPRSLCFYKVNPFPTSEQTYDPKAIIIFGGKIWRVTDIGLLQRELLRRATSADRSAEPIQPADQPCLLISLLLR